MLVLLAALAHAEGPSRDLPGEAMPDRHWDFHELALDLKIDLEGRSVQGTATHTVAALGTPHRWLRLHQRALDIQGVHVDGKAVEGWRQGHETLDVPMPIGPGEHTVAVTYRANPQKGLHFRDPSAGPDRVVHVWSQGEDEDNRHWLPTWDHPSDRFRYTGRLVVPDGMHAVSNGTLTGTEPAEPGWTAWSYTMGDHDLVGYLVMVAAGDFRVVHDDRARVPLEYIVPSTVSEATAKRSMEHTVDQLAWFDKTLAPHSYPYPLYRQVLVTRFLYSGMENTTSTILGDHLLVAPGERARWPAQVGAHELAHQWFGDWLTCYGWRELWLNEGFAKYWEHRWREHRWGAADYAATKRAYRGYAMGADKRPMAARSWSKAGGDNVSVYTRGSAVLRMLEVHLGRELFDRAIRRYVANNRGRLVESDDLRRALEDASGQHLGWLFDQYVHGTGFPSAKTGWSWADGVLTIQLDQTTETTPFSVPVQIEIGASEGEPIVRTVWLGAGATQLVLDREAAPAWVAIDPLGGTLVNWTEEQEATAWVAQLQHSPSPYARIVAMEHLADQGSNEGVTAALAAVLHSRQETDEFRSQAAVALGQIATPDAIDALIRAVEPRPEPSAWTYTREAAVDALAKVPPEDKAVAALQARLRDADPVVSASAITALAALDAEAGLGAARKRLKSPDTHTQRVEHGQALIVLRKHGDESDLSSLAKLAAATHHRAVRHGAMRAIAGIVDRAEDLPDKQRRKLIDAVLPSLHDLDLKSRRMGIWTLARIGDAHAAAALRALANETTIDPLADSARDAVERIEKRLAGDKEPKQSDEETDPPLSEVLGDRVDELEERLQRLEEWR